MARDLFRQRLRHYFTSEWVKTKDTSLKRFEKLLNSMYTGVHDDILANYKNLNTLDIDGLKYTVHYTEDDVAYYYSELCMSLYHAPPYSFHF